MKTEIYKTYTEFLGREDKSLNGVSSEFATANEGWDKERGNSGCYDCSDCSDCSRCYDCYDCYDCSRCYDCYDCSGCYDCSDCYDCSRCYDCYDCYDCSDCYDKNEHGDMSFVVPKIESIHSKVLNAASGKDALNMYDWHTCETTHCRAGWVVTLAGKAGFDLEKKTSTLFAAMQIYHASSPIEVNCPRYFEDNEKAMADMKRCAELESK